MIYLINGVFNAAHKIDDCPVSEGRVHGHAWRIQAEVAVSDDEVFKTGRNDALHDGDLEGMLDAILLRFDCSFMGSAATIECLFGRETEPVGDRHILVTRGAPTVAEVARIFYRELSHAYDELAHTRKVELHLTAVTVFETDRCGVRYAPEEKR